MSNDTSTTKLELKPLEIGVGAGAAVVTAFASSYLGTAGTLTGAALASAIGTVATSVLRTSAGRGAESLRWTTERLRPTRTGPELDSHDIDPDGSRLAGAPDLAGTDQPGDGQQAAAEQTGPDSAVLGGTGPGTTGIGSGTGTLGTTAGRRAARPRWVVLGVGAAASFALALGAITGIESAAGKPLDAITGGGSGTGTTLDRVTGDDGGSSGTDPQPSTTSTPTSTPSGEPTATPTESAGSGGEPTGSPEASLSPSPVPSATATVPVPTATDLPAAPTP